MRGRVGITALAVAAAGVLGGCGGSEQAREAIPSWVALNEACNEAARAEEDAATAKQWATVERDATLPRPIRVEASQRAAQAENRRIEAQAMGLALFRTNGWISDAVRAHANRLDQAPERIDFCDTRLRGYVWARMARAVEDLPQVARAAREDYLRSVASAMRPDRP